MGLGQIDVHSIATSLGADTLPPTLKTEWETVTKRQKGVPPVEELVAFMREKSDSICTLGKKGEPAFLPKVQKGGGAHQPPNHKSKVSVHVVDSVPQVTSSLPAGSASPQGSGRPKGYNKQLNKGPAVGIVSPQGAAPTQVASQYFKPPCAVCSGNHPVYFCPDFLGKIMQQRQDLVVELRLCRNCLRVGHAAVACRSEYRCRTCKGRHNTVLHYSNSDNSNNTNNSDPQVNTSAAAVDAIVTVAGHSNKSIPSSLLMTSQVLLTGPSGKSVVARALLDSGATLSLLTRQTMAALELEPSDVSVKVTGVENTTTSGACPLATFAISSLHRPKEKMEMVAAVVAQATGTLPLQGAKSVVDIPHIKGLQLADPNFFLPGKIDVLLGENILDKVLLPHCQSGPPGTPSAWNTIFGWAIRGVFTPDSEEGVSRAGVNVLSVGVAEDDCIKKFWEVEEVPSHSTHLTQLEAAVEQNYRDTTKYLAAERRYEVRLPRSNLSAALGESQGQALQRFFSNEKAIIRKGTWESFQGVVQEYMDLGHACKVTEEELRATPPGGVLPAHACSSETSQ